MKLTDKLIHNIAVLEHDITELTDMIQRYVKCNSDTLIELAKDLRESRQVLLLKKTQLIRKLHEIQMKQSDGFVDDYLQDYREVLDYQNNVNLSDEDKQLFANDEAREEVQGRFTHQLNY